MPRKRAGLAGRIRGAYTRTMVVLSTLFTALFLSPLVFVLLIALAAILLGARKRRAAVSLLGATALVLLVLSIGLVRDALLRPLEDRYPPSPDSSPFAAIVVLGGGVLDGAPDEGKAASLSPEAFKRLAYGFILFRRTGAPLVVSGGRVWKGDEGEPEAEVAARTLAKLGVPDRLVTREARSRTTWENAREVAVIVGRAKAGRVALVTSAYHMPRAMLAFTKAGIACIPAPTDYKSSRGRVRPVDFLPSFEALGGSFKALREYIGILQYSMKR